jgi:hypothetical protein
LLWRFPMGGKAFANPISYVAADGKQHVAIACGHTLFSLAWSRFRQFEGLRRR